MSNLPWAECHFVVVDIEGNGQVPQEIIELSIVPIFNNQVGSPCSWLIRPKKPVTELANQIHGISNSDLVGCRSAEEVREEIIKTLGKSIVVGHNVTIDTQLIRNQFGDWYPKAILDTLRLAKYVRPGLQSYSLDSLLNTYDLKINPSARHRATGDAKVTAELFLALTTELGEKYQLDLRTLSQVAGSKDDPFINNQQGSLF